MDSAWFECEYDATDGIIVYSFQITEYNLNGWVWCRMVHIHRQSRDGTITNVEYDPTIHDGTNHYMSAPYRARHNKKTNTLKVFKGDGSLFSATIRGL